MAEKCSSETAATAHFSAINFSAIRNETRIGVKRRLCSRFVSPDWAPPPQAGDELRMLAAVKLFEMKRFSSGAAAKLAGIPRTLFLQRLGDYGVSTFDMSEDEFQRETRLI